MVVGTAVVVGEVEVGLLDGALDRKDVGLSVGASVGNVVGEVEGTVVGVSVQVPLRLSQVPRQVAANTLSEQLSSGSTTTHVSAGSSTPAQPHRLHFSGQKLGTSMIVHERVSQKGKSNTPPVEHVCRRCL